MAKGKADFRQTIGSTVHVKCTHLFSTKLECSRTFGSSFNSVFVDGTVEEVIKRTSDSGRRSTHIKIKFRVAGVAKITKVVALGKVHDGPAPGKRPPSPEVEIVTPAKISEFNRDDRSDGPPQSNLHRVPKAKSSADIPPGFMSIQRYWYDDVNKKKQKVSIINCASINITEEIYGGGKINKQQILQSICLWSKGSPAHFECP